MLEPLRVRTKADTGGDDALLRFCPYEEVDRFGRIILTLYILLVVIFD